MAASISFFPVSNGDMTLLSLDNGQTILIDVRVRAAADDEQEDSPDVASDLRERLVRRNGRLTVDVFLSTHPHQDHITGLRKHFHLGSPDSWDKDEDKIFIAEMWSSPLVFQRAKRPDAPLCDDAEAWADEARRRVKRFRRDGFATEAGDRILIMGEDATGDNSDISDIVLKLDETVDQANRVAADAFEARLLAPEPAEDEETERNLSGNESSVVMRFALAGDGVADCCRFLTGGDAEVAIWKRIWERLAGSNSGWLSYHILQTPHHCSWRSLSFDSWSDLGENAEVDDQARDALAQIEKGAIAVASSKPVKADDDNPPHHRAKREYVDIVDGDEDRFYCTDEHWRKNGRTLEFEIKASGITLKLPEASQLAPAALGISASAAQPRQHG